MGISRVLALLAVSAVFLFPTVSYAANASFFGPIIPDGTNGQPNCHCEDVQGSDGTILNTAPEWGCVLATVGNLINFTISIGVIIFILVVLYAGLLFLTSPFKAENRELGRSILMNAVIGVVIMLSAWILIDFIMKTVYKGSDAEGAEFGPWNSILTGNEDSYCIAPTAQPVDAPIPGTYVTPGSLSEASGITDEQARNAFAQNGFSFSATDNNCTENRAGCTYLGGLQSATINTLIAFGRSCDAPLVITGGTEPGHSSAHARGYKIDIRNSQGATACVLDVAERYPAGDRGGDHGGPAYIDGCGNIFVQESNHWDILVVNSCNYDS